MSASLQQRLNQLATIAACSRKHLKTSTRVGGRDLKLYRAGLREGKDWFGLFGRDLLITALLLRRPAFTREVLRFVSATLGTCFDPRTGEEPGRGLHEFDDVEMRGLSTRYNACEVSLLFLVAAADELATSNDAVFVEEIAVALASAVAYLLRHFAGGLFLEDPAVCGANRYALRATYWKDSHLPGREDPAYPATYTLVQAQAVAALRAAAELVEHLPESPATRVELSNAANRGVERLLDDLWDSVLDVPMIALDQEGPIRGVSSDALHMLTFLEPRDVPGEMLQAIERGAEALATPFGYRSYAPSQADYDANAYHLGAVWPFEQALIARGATLHGLVRAPEVALRVVDALEQLGFPELFYWDHNEGLTGATSVAHQGCDLQLWTLAVPGALLSLLSQTEETNEVGGSR